MINSAVAAEHSLQFVPDAVIPDTDANNEVDTNWCRTFARRQQGLHRRRLRRVPDQRGPLAADADLRRLGRQVLRRALREHPGEAELGAPGRLGAARRQRLDWRGHRRPRACGRREPALQRDLRDRRRRQRHDPGEPLRPDLGFARPELAGVAGRTARRARAGSSCSGRTRRTRRRARTRSTPSGGPPPPRASATRSTTSAPARASRARSTRTAPSARALRATTCRTPATRRTTRTATRPTTGSTSARRRRRTRRSSTSVPAAELASAPQPAVAIFCIATTTKETSGWPETSSK